jgi:hypothetical protein
MPPLLCAIDELHSTTASDRALDSLTKIYEQAVSFKVYFSDYFNFSSESVLEDISISPELNLEHYLHQRLYLTNSKDTINEPFLHILKSHDIKLPLVAIVQFSLPSTPLKREYQLVLKSADDSKTPSIIYRMHSASLEQFVHL